MAGTEGGANPLVFISCGQYTPEEKRLGRQLVELIEKHTPARGYFAENQNSLDGLTRHILGALNRCCGFVAVMHHRGNVKTLHGEHVRGSLWIEQELAIASFLLQVQEKVIPCVVYIQRGIKREGIREQLLLGAVEFETADEVLRDFRSRLESSQFDVSRAPTTGTHPEAVLSYSTRQTSAAFHLHQLEAVVKNGAMAGAAMDDYWIELELPRKLLKFWPNNTYSNEVKERGTKSHRFFRWAEGQVEKLYPGDIFSRGLEYGIDDLLHDTPGFLSLPITLRVGMPDRQPLVITKSVREMTDF